MGPYSPGGWAAAPYSAVEEFWVLQVLNDGTVASSKRQSTTKIYQDSHGRRRRERPLCSQLYENAKAVLVSIDDPVAGYEYDLDPQNRIAYRYSLKALKDSVPAAGGNRSSPHMEVTKEPLGSQWMRVYYSTDGWDLPKVVECLPSGRLGYVSCPLGYMPADTLLSFSAIVRAPDGSDQYVHASDGGNLFGKVK